MLRKGRLPAWTRRGRLSAQHKGPRLVRVVGYSLCDALTLTAWRPSQILDRRAA